MLKGKIEIELTNVKTGEKEKHVKENMITNAPTIIAKSALSVGGGSPFFPIYSRMLGGLMIFDGTLTENASNVNFPSNAKLVGYAGRKANTNKMAGSIDPLESGEIENGYKTTWTFSTSQACTKEGQSIQSLSLTYNDTNNDCNPFWGSSLVNIIGEKGTDIGPHTPTVFFNSERYYKIKDVNATAQGSNRILTAHLYSCEKTMRSWGVKTLYGTTAWKFDRDIIITVPLEGTYNVGPIGITYGYDGYLYVPFVNGNSSGDGIIRYVKIKVDDESFAVSELYTVTCSGCNFGYGSESNWHVSICNGKAFVLGQGNSLCYLVDLQNGNHIDVDFGSYWYEPNIKPKIFPSGVYSLCTTKQNGTVYDYHETLVYPNGEYVIDSPYLTGTSPSWGGSRDYHTYFSSDLLMCSGQLYYYATIYPINNYLGTICNLASPVVKTNEQTMKITYTLTDA